MLFRKHKKVEMEEDYEFGKDEQTIILEALMSYCEDGTVYEDAFVLEDEDIYIYADVLANKNNVVQVMFQLHHEWMEEAVNEVVAAVGETKEEAITQAVKQYCEQTLSVYLQAVHESKALDQIEAFTQERHYFHVYRGNVSGIGKREGLATQDFWTLLKEDIAAHLGNKKLYWIKIFASKQGDKVLCEMRINGKEAVEISQRLLKYAGSWDCISDTCTEKQTMMFVQDKLSYQPSDFTKQEIMNLTNKAIRLYEKCLDKEDHKKLRGKLIQLCDDDSLAYEIFGFIPELYCKYAYPQIEIGEKLFLVQKNKKTRELYQSQLQSFAYIEECVEQYFKEMKPSTDRIQNVLLFSSNANAIRKAIAQGDVLEELMVPGIAYIAKDTYQLR